MTDGVIGNLWVRIKADLKDFKESMSNLGGKTPALNETREGFAEVEAKSVSAGFGMDVFGSKLAQVSAQSAGFGKYSRMIGQSFRELGPALNGVKKGLSDSMYYFKVGRATGNDFTTSLKMMGVGLKLTSASLKTFAVSLVTALAPLIAIMAIIQIATWLWDKYKENQEKVRKETDAINLATRSLGVSMDQARNSIKKYGNEWATLSQQMLGFGVSAKTAVQMATQMAETAKILNDLWKVPNEDIYSMISASLSKGLEGLKDWGVFMDEAQLKQYAFNEGIISEGDAWDYAAQQAAIMQAIYQQIQANKGIKMTDDLKALAKSALEAKKSLGLMSFDMLNTIKQSDEMQNPFEGLLTQFTYDNPADVINGANEAAKKFKVTVAGINATSLNGVVDGWNNIKNWGGWSYIAGKAGDAFDWIKEKGGNVLKGIQVGGTVIWDSMGNKARDVWKTITEIIPKFFSVAIDSIAKLFSGLWERVKKGFADTLSKIPIIGDLAKGVSGAVGGIKSFLGLAGGGAAMPGKPGIVTIGDNMKEPEIVAPQSYIMEAVADALSMIGGVGQQTITVNLNLDGVTVAKQIVRPLTQEQRRLGL